VKTLAERFEARVHPEPTTGCHLWIGGEYSGGYGKFGLGVRGSAMLAHRFAWELVHGPVPAGLCVLHKCDTPACCNVDHLFIGTRPENSADMVAKGRYRSANGHKTACAHGHSFTPENTWTGANGHRHCRACLRERGRQYAKNRRRS
jgi:hypothetical protein